MKGLMLFVFLTTMLAVSVHGQPQKESARPTTSARTHTTKPPPQPSLLELSAEAIQEERPQISHETLLEDANAVYASLPAIKYTYAKMELDAKVAEKAALFGWKQLRLGPLEPNAALSPSYLINFVIGRGVLVIKSTPTGATVELDGTPLPETTEAVQFPSPGTYRIRLSLPGFEAVEENCNVSADKKTEFIKTLNPIPKKKPK